MFSFNFTDGKFALHNDFYFSLLSNFLFILCFYSIYQKYTNQSVWENHTPVSKYLNAKHKRFIILYLFYIAALDFNPFIYFRF